MLRVRAMEGGGREGQELKDQGESKREGKRGKMKV